MNSKRKCFGLFSCFCLNKSHDRGREMNIVPENQEIMNGNGGNSPKLCEMKINSFHQKQDLKVSEFNPKPEDLSGEKLKYQCPICFRFFNRISKFSCCQNYICILCAEDMQKRSVIGVREVNDGSGIRCAFCSNSLFAVDAVADEEKIRNYFDNSFEKSSPRLRMKENVSGFKSDRKDGIKASDSKSNKWDHSPNPNPGSESKGKKIHTYQSSILGESSILRVGSPLHNKTDLSTKHPSMMVSDRAGGDIGLRVISVRGKNKSELTSHREGNNEMDSSYLFTASRCYLEEKEYIPEILLFDPDADSIESLQSQSNPRGFDNNVLSDSKLSSLLSQE